MSLPATSFKAKPSKFKRQKTRTEQEQICESPSWNLSLLSENVSCQVFLIIDNVRLYWCSVIYVPVNRLSSSCECQQLNVNYKQHQFRGPFVIYIRVDDIRKNRIDRLASCRK